MKRYFRVALLTLLIGGLPSTALRVYQEWEIIDQDVINPHYTDYTPLHGSLQVLHTGEMVYVPENWDPKTYRTWPGLWRRWVRYWHNFA